MLDGVEEEQPSELDILHPFDPTKIKIRTATVVVEQLFSRIKHREIDLAPEFQRNKVWNLRNKSRLIESLLLKIPIPVFYVASDQHDNWAVVDGVQRISTLSEFYTGEFSLKHLEYLDSLDGKYYEDLKRVFQRRINETQLIINIIEWGTPEEVMFNIFSRINTGGVTLTSQEIRHAMNKGPVRNFLRDLAESQEFLRATNRSISSRRMADRECALRFLAFYIEPWEFYSSSDFNGFLGNAMKAINQQPITQRQQYFAAFRASMNAAHQIFGTEAFRKPPDYPSLRRKPINKALFEIWSVQLARCKPHERKRLIANRNKVVNNFNSLFDADHDFTHSISASTASARQVKIRFETIKVLVEEILK